MNMKKYIKAPMAPILCVSVILGLTACSSGTKKENKNEGSTATVVSSSKGSNSFSIRPYKKQTLENGLEVYFITDTSLPRVSIQALVKVGAVNESLDKAGLNALTAYLFEQGTSKRNATVIADELGTLGTNLTISPDNDFTSLGVDALSNGSYKMLDLFADILMSPMFAEKEIQRTKNLMLAGIKKKIDNPSEYASSEMSKYLYGAGARYGLDTEGTEESLKALRKKDIMKHYLAYYRPNNTALAVVGNFDAMFEEKVKATFGAWQKKTTPKLVYTEPTEVPGFKVKLIVKKGLQQTQIRFSHFGIERKNPDFLTLRLGNETFGGGFAGRLNQKIRDDLGLTYSIYSYFDVRLQKGSFEISTFTKNENAVRVVDEVKKVLETYLAEGATDKEVSASKNQLVGQFPRAIETADRLAFNLMALDAYGIPHSYLTDYNETVMGISASEAKKAMNKVLKVDNFKVLVYGDPSIVPQFEKYKPEVVHLP